MLILSWMPFEVRKTYKEMQEKMTFSYCAIGLYSLWVINDFILGLAGCLHTDLISTLLLLAWQGVSDFMPDSTGHLLSDWHHSHSGLDDLTGSEWFNARSSWVPSDCSLVLLAWWQQVSDFMPGPAGCPLTILTPTLVLLAGQLVSHCLMPVSAGCLQWLFSLQHWSCWLDRLWVISCQVQLGAF